MSTKEALKVQADSSGLDQDRLDYLLGKGAYEGDTPDTVTVEGAAVRPERVGQSEAERQTGIAQADRVNRAAAGLAPRVHDLM